MGSIKLQNGAPEPEVFDVVIVGAGISGINAAYRLRSQLPDTTFTILEGRDALGGTWDLFRYPGIRSDSDLFTFGFQWEPWPYETPIAQGPLIREYMKSCVKKHGLDRHMRFHHKVLAADWSSETNQWKVTADHDGQTKQFRANWVILGTGYYDYENPLKAMIPGLENYKGKIIHPQHWPEDYDHSGKKIAVIGSGATAITLIPALSETAGAVTMVQRSPSYIVSLTNRSPARSWLMKLMPKYVAGTWLRILHVWRAYTAVLFSRYFPQRAKKLFIKLTIPQLPQRIPQNPHFEPFYNPWQQRLCLSPDGDFFQALRDKPTTNVVTGHIDTATETGIRMKDGTTIDADVIVTATGLQMRMGGDVAVTVNGEKINWGGRLLWHGSMIQDVPNMMFVIGYVDASWTLGADSTAHSKSHAYYRTLYPSAKRVVPGPEVPWYTQLREISRYGFADAYSTVLVRLLKYMKSKNVSTAVPRVPPGGTNGYRKFWHLTSNYREAAESVLPRYGNIGPWKPKMSPPLDWMHGKWGDIVTGLHFAA